MGLCERESNAFDLVKSEIYVKSNTLNGFKTQKLKFIKLTAF